MKNPHPVGLIATVLGLLVACTLSYQTLAGPAGDGGDPEFRFRDASGAERVVPAGQLYFKIYTEPSKWSRYSRRSVFDPESGMHVKFTEMASFTIQRGPDGYLVTFTTPEGPEARTLGFEETKAFLGEEFFPAMLIKRRGQWPKNHQHIVLDDIEWPIEVRR